MRFPLVLEPIKIYHYTPADDLLQAVNSIIITFAREIFFFLHIHTQIAHVGGLETEAIITNKCVPPVTFWFPGYCGFADLNG